MNSPRTAREALIAEMLGDLDLLLARVEALPAGCHCRRKTYQHGHGAG